jgi:CRP/FNR family transcriptional regulator, dissimilatory nitrate respiration regulator
MDREEKIHAIANLTLFAGLPEEQARSLALLAEVRRAARGKTLFRAGDPAPGFFAVVSGRVRIFRSAPSGKEHILHVFGPGEVFAEVAVFQGGPYPADADVLDDCVLLFFPRNAFRKLLADDPDTALGMLGLLASRLRQFVNKIEELSLKEVPARLAAHLLLLHEAQGKRRLTLDLSKGHLAAYLGTIPETLSRILRKMADEGLLDTTGSAISLRDVERLARIAEGEKL